MPVPFDYLRTSWIAFFTLWSLWGLVYFVRHAFDIPNVDNKSAPSPQPTTDDLEAANPPANPPANPSANPPANKKEEEEGIWDILRPSMPERLARAHQVLLENSLMLLSVLCLYTFGSNGSRAVMILSWIFFAFTVVHAFTELALKHYIPRLVFSLVFYGVTLAIGGLAFRQGWA